MVLLVTIFELFFARLDTTVFATDYTLTITEQGAPTTTTGTITMQGTRFVGTLFGSEAAFDGKTLYVYSEDLNEITLTHPTPEEQIDSNPLLYARKLYEEYSTDDRSPLDIDMNEQTGMPRAITLREGQSRYRITFRNPRWLTEAPPFTLSHPNAYHNDLR